MSTNLKLCRDCKWSIQLDNDWLLHCKSPEVNKRDAFALAAKEPVSGTGCREERNKGFFSACGRRGAQWEAA